MKIDLHVFLMYRIAHPWRKFILYRNEVLSFMKIMLNQMLDQKGISQNQLAKDSGVSINTLRNLNHNRTTRISFDTLEKICSCLDCNVGDILSV